MIYLTKGCFCKFLNRFLGLEPRAGRQRVVLRSDYLPSLCHLRWQLLQRAMVLPPCLLIALIHLCQSLPKAVVHPAKITRSRDRTIRFHPNHLTMYQDQFPIPAIAPAKTVTELPPLPLVVSPVPPQSKSNSLEHHTNATTNAQFRVFRI